CDPMHGNTVTAEQGLKTRRYEDIFQEIESFFDIHQKLKSFPGGIHLELTGADVTECTGGAIGLNEADLEARYHTQCDPRLNVDQSIEIAFALSDYLVAGR
ncbi:MAG TPA: 3-deoxy-7-phosphoheptulonate synthase class II, partial [Gammaproteobacteria bacterium]|nr:3-deoxy-7-phosphoheptulonate synthase class II [Gammaproteobacteria bacterium]